MLISSTTAAAMLGITTRTLAEWTKKGEGPPAHRVHGLAGAVYHREEVEAWAKENGKWLSTNKQGDPK